MAAQRQAEAEGRRRSDVQQAGGVQGFGVAMSSEQQRLQAEDARRRGIEGQAYAQQQDVYNMLQAQATGQAGPSQAQLMQAQAGQQNIVDQQAMAAQGQGGNLAAQARASQGIGAAGQMGNIQQMAQLQQQEQLAAQQALAGQANTMGSMAMGAGQFAAGQNQATNLAVQGAAQQQGQFNTTMAFQQQQANRDLAMQGVEMGLGAAEGAAMMSDERVKDIEAGEAGEEALEAVRQIRPIAYRYKDGVPGAKGRILGFTTQRLGRTEAGAATTFDTPIGKAVDLGKAVSLGLAGLAELTHRVDRMAG
jgi:hypothetical protein